MPGAEPTGIVRLADLVTPCSPDYSSPKDTAAASRSTDCGASPEQSGSRSAVAAEWPAVGRVRRAFGHGLRRGVHKTPDVAGAGDTTAQARAPSDQVEVEEHSKGSVTTPADEAGPLYESLFGPEATSKARRSRRERPPATAMQRALGLLTRREHSRKELTRKLVARGVDAGEVAAAVDRLTDAGWQDERRFAENLLRARASGGYGPLHIRAELATHDLPADLRSEVMEAFDGDWTEIAADLVRRRFGRIEDARVRERKAADFLVRRGFPGEVVRVASRSIPDGD